MTPLNRIMRDEEATRYPRSSMAVHVILFALAAPPIAAVQFMLYGAMARAVGADPVAIILTGVGAAILGVCGVAYLTFHWSKA